MNSNLSDVAHVFVDLEAAYESLQDARDSPREVRRLFAQFVTLTQQLTEAVRREFSARTKQSWAASQFPGWNNVTDLFKELRRTDFHGTPLRILVRETQVRRTDLGVLLQCSGTWELHDQQADAAPEGMVLVRADPVRDEPTDDPLPLVRRTFVFHLHPRSVETERLLQEIGNIDLHILASKCIAVLRDYYKFYQDALANAETP